MTNPKLGLPTWHPLQQASSNPGPTSQHSWAEYPLGQRLTGTLGPSIVDVASCMAAESPADMASGRPLYQTSREGGNPSAEQATVGPTYPQPHADSSVDMAVQKPATRLQSPSAWCPIQAIPG
ncbi:hypothetical protein AMTR_s00048p00230240 [Amborella trichopoda]|uniref:Uncharacterized protein n=1 Tax=Amborella trichopoda TaxID=13333 RepID=U5D5T2_AMBTC|nr:hypothetical protein AMTR_s00048p00230240 [Amborella trichopoda]